MSDVAIMNWGRAKKHFDQVRNRYLRLRNHAGEGSASVNVTTTLRFVFEPLAVRYGNGERSRDLYGAMLSVE